MVTRFTKSVLCSVAGCSSSPSLTRRISLHSPLWKITQHFNGQAKKMQEASKVMDEFVYRIIDQREKEGLGNLTRDDKKDVASKDLLSLYMALRDENGKPLSKKALRCALFITAWRLLSGAFC